jgi:hypothetical protein
MDIQVTTERTGRDPAYLLGVLCYIAAVISYMLQSEWRIGYSDVETFLIPVVPWLLAVGLLLRYRKRTLRHYWWILPTVIIANPTLLLMCIMLRAWSIGGFV